MSAFGANRGKRALAIQHFATGGLGILASVLDERGYDVTVIEATADAVTRASSEHWDLVVVLGSEDGVYEDHDYIAPEIALVRERLDRDAPTLGICFGAQIMAAAIGGSVYRGSPGPEIGFVTVEPTEQGRLSPLRHVAGVPVCEWHGDTFSLPVSVVPLGSTERYGNQAFALGDTAFAVQFHPEMTRSMFGLWVADGAADIERAGLDVSTLLAEADAHLAAAGEASRRMFGEFLDSLPAERSAEERSAPGALSATR